MSCLGYIIRNEKHVLNVNATKKIENRQGVEKTNIVVFKEREIMDGIENNGGNGQRNNGQRKILVYGKEYPIRVNGMKTFVRTLLPKNA